MKHEAEIRERYLSDPVPIRLGGLAANLARIRSFSLNERNRDAVGTLIEECRHFIEWTASEVDPEAQGLLAALQLQLAQWNIQTLEAWQDPVFRAGLSRQAGDWSDRVLQMSGLLDPPAAVREKRR